MSPTQERKSPSLDRTYSGERLGINISAKNGKQIPIVLDIDSDDTIGSIKGKILTELRRKPNFRGLTIDDIVTKNLSSSWPPDSNNLETQTAEIIARRLSQRMDIIAVVESSKGGGKRKKRRTKRRTNRI